MNVSPRGSGAGASPAKFAHYRQQDQVVQDVSAFNTGVMNYTGGTVSPSSCARGACRPTSSS